MKPFKNRNGNIIEFVKIEEHLYKFTSTGACYWRFGEELDDLQFVDPEGGPFVGIGYIFDNQEVVKILNTKDGVYLKTK